MSLKKFFKKNSIVSITNLMFKYIFVFSLCSVALVIVMSIPISLSTLLEVIVINALFLLPTAISFLAYLVETKSKPKKQKPNNKKIGNTNAETLSKTKTKQIIVSKESVYYRPKTKVLIRKRGNKHE